MTTSDLKKAIAKSTGFSQKDAAEVFNATIDIIINTLMAGDPVPLPGIGTFKVKTRPERAGINPATKEKIVIPERRVLKFMATKSFKDRLAGK